jgi:hypothetical protein
VSERDDQIPPSYVVIHEQPATSVYVNPRGQVVIRQVDYYDGDMWVAVSVEHVPALLAAIERWAGSPEAGFRPLEDEPDPEQPEATPDRTNDALQPEPASGLGNAQTPEATHERIRAALIAGGKSNRHVARELGCSEATVRRVAAKLTSSERDSRCDSHATPGATLAPDAHDDASPTHVLKP